MGACGGETSQPTEATPGDCSDLADNDRDGHIDCGDQDCQVFAVCVGAGDGDADADGDGDGDGDGDSDVDGGPEPGEEVCNGLDDDLDGQADEGDPGSGVLCPTGLAVRCGPGHTRCEDGAIICVPEVAPEDETCGNSGVDDDCNGLVDDIQGLGVACATGLRGICAQGTGACDGDEFGCLMDNSPSDETCPNGLDDDCDGDVDNGPDPIPESCANPGVDDDCNGVVDDVFGIGDPCATGLEGACNEGTGVCRNLAFACDPPAVGDERCSNLLDDDCDGEVDELDCSEGLCSEIALEWCTAKGWFSGVGDEAMGGNLVCTIDNRGFGHNCDACATYNIIVWADASGERGCQGESYSTAAGSVYGGHSPCQCGDNLVYCEDWPMFNCTPD